jgi:hypothetical protein
MAFDFKAHAGAGSENINKDVLGMPILSILQKGSPQFDETHKNYGQKQIEGCRPGDLYFAPSNSVLKRPLEVIVTGTATLYTEWKPKSVGGGFIGNRPLTVTAQRGYSKGKPGTKEEHKEYLDGNELVYTIYVSLMFKKLPDSDEWEKAIISFTSTQLKKARLWLKALLNLKVPGTDITAPLFASIWSIKTEAEQNKEGGWFGYDIKLVRVMDAVKEEALLNVAHETFVEVQASLPQARAAVAAITGGADTELVDDKDAF